MKNSFPLIWGNHSYYKPTKTIHRCTWIRTGKESPCIHQIHVINRELLPSVLIFFWDKMVSCFLSLRTSTDCMSLSLVSCTSSLCCRSHICCSSAISCWRASIDFCSELMVISKGPSSTPCKIKESIRKSSHLIIQHSNISLISF